MKHLILITALLSHLALFSQDNKALAEMKGKQAIRIMDEGKLDESIAMLEECKKLDPDNYVYPYEMAYAYTFKKNYDKVIEILEDLTSYKGINSQIYQMLGNAYSYKGKSDKALKAYDKGLKKFPDAGNLYLEKGNVYLHKEAYDDAIKNYEEGIAVDPMFPSNYYRMADLYLGSTDKLTGLIYGELFLNLEPSSARAEQMSKRLFETYKSAIVLDEDNMEINFCEIVLDAKDLTEKELRLPLCAIFGKNFIMGILGQGEVNLQTLSDMRTAFLNNYYQEDYKTHPNLLFSYQKKLLDKGLFEAYNYYTFMMGDEAAFNTWLEAHPTEFDTFRSWYNDADNQLVITKENRFIRD